MYFKKAFQYRLNTLMLSIGQVFTVIGEFCAVYLLFAQFITLNEWSFYQICLTFGIVTFGFPLGECIGRGFDNCSKLVQSGDFDRILTRPRSVFFQVLCSDFELSKLSRVFFGLIVIIVSLCKLNIAWTFYKVVLIIAMALCSMVISFSLFVFSAGIVMFSIKNMEFMNIFTYGGKDCSTYPVNVFGHFIKNFFTFIVPIACYNYLPLTYLCDMPNSSFWLNGMAPFYGMLFIIPCALFFNWATKFYKSTGS